MIKVAFCIAYDWRLLKKSLPRVYELADQICLSIDERRHSWAGKPYEFDQEAFFSFVQEIDQKKKIKIIEGNFSSEKNNSRKNGNIQRQAMADALGKGGWHIQIDADEYFLDFPGYVQFLKKIHPHPSGQEKPLNVCANWIPLIKKVPGGFLWVDFKDQLPEMAPFASNFPEYQRARHNGHFNVMSPYYVIHETWARSEDELWFKMNNWGHASEELDSPQKRVSYYELWKSLDRYNCHYLRDFHPASPPTWPGLSFAPGENVEAFMENFKSPDFPLNKWQLNWQNNRNLARLKGVFQKFGLK